MGYQQGLSGLAGASSDLDVIGNNIANANTVGFKGSTAQFSDMYANSVASAVNNPIGIGTMLASVQQQFSQGTITSSTSSLNVAINGNGFFQMSNNGVLTYSRDGTFQRDKNGYIVNSQGLNLMGYQADKNGVINPAQTVPLQAPTNNIAPTATTKITGQFNLNSQDTVPTNTPFNYTDSTTYNFQTAVQVYDSLGGSQQVNMYFVKSAAGTWEAYAGVKNQTPTDLGTVTFDTSGAIKSTTLPGSTTPTTTLGQFQFSIPNTDGSATPQALKLDLTGTTQYGGKDGVTNLAQDGFASGTLTTFSIGNDGKVTGNYSNGQTATLGQIVLANFNNPNGLVNVGNNQYVETAASGVPQISAPGSTNHGTLQGSALENSNVDLTSQLVKLITAQRNYQANAQTIKTQQTVDQTLINL
ncbi:flagellar hook protein FlgE [Burkholderia thailandensis]|uniref:Flagellar hook protein FlgE n=1 Tax=Burkholderia thailandensis (strain ATCC 700388 / DSM 13276 / CCUG 48851 / CIP 106301 / E264) TaxID=271848 RepID=Q2T1Z8_BURTA|nr:flagellar hook protein FlgE [Burkholderia thailandensis]ABC37299.1 flagellar hook protein FlgE [Burkholderia thailandensis E264]AHI72214.1 flagellar hook-basal body family protein [Burkholderia thailandensis 2002721723]AHI79317.1 flagellar hook-basal body family protein [Burkholderia thailandensis E444]AIC86425.1 flagellar hook-basal body family protein [Burkholderia thailandensis USAMRU Malaysia \